LVSLLDVNVLVALFDGVHVHHEAAHAWFAAHRELGWATCPLTENGLVRVVSSSAYPGRRTTLADALSRLATLRSSGHHHFWEDSVSLCDAGRVDATRIGGPRRITDTYLLALAVANEGRLVTFDREITPAAVRGATSRQLLHPG
jgi:hypothetical protein